ncbi:hypothetical protein FXW78_55055 [Rhodococcus opacus]|nr:hypothetical protein [Rhodococcus opacus]
MATFHANGAGDLRVSTVEGHDLVIITVDRDLALHIPTAELPAFIDNLRDALEVLAARED